ARGIGQAHGDVVRHQGAIVGDADQQRCSSLVQRENVHPGIVGRPTSRIFSAARENPSWTRRGAPGGGALQSPCPPACAALRPPPLLTTGGHPHPALPDAAAIFCVGHVGPTSGSGGNYPPDALDSLATGRRTKPGSVTFRSRAPPWAGPLRSPR